MQQLWINANGLAHEKLVNVLEDKTGHGISTGNGVVTLDLSQLVTEIGTELGVPASALDKIPPDTGVITVMRSDQLSAAQTAVQGVRVLSTALLVLVLALYALAIYLARGERRQTLRNIGFAFMLVGLTVLVVRRVAGNVAIDALTAPQGESAGRRAWLIGSEILMEIGWAVILYGAIAVAGSIFAGPTKAATSLRGRVAPVLNERPGIAWAAVGTVFLLLVLWGGTHALRTWWGIVLLGALLAIGVVALRHQTLARVSQRASQYRRRNSRPSEPRAHARQQQQQQQRAAGRLPFHTNQVTRAGAARRRSQCRLTLVMGANKATRASSCNCGQPASTTKFLPTKRTPEVTPQSGERLSERSAAESPLSA